MSRWHIGAYPLTPSGRKVSEPIGAIIDAEDALHALDYLRRKLDHQSFVDEAKVPLRDLEAIRITVERTDKESA